MCDLGRFLHRDMCPGKINVQLINTEMAGQFTLQIDSSLMIGLVMGVPYLLYELWKFIKPALHEKERKAANGFVFYASVLFIAGVMFGYFIITPVSINFLGRLYGKHQHSELILYRFLYFLGVNADPGYRSGL